MLIKIIHHLILIEPSIYETNSFLNSKQFCVTCDFNLYEYLVKRNDDLSLINYAAFFGSIQIFNYLISQKVEIKPSIWIYAIHGQNAEIIQYIENIHIEPEDKSYFDCLNESIKCHHNGVAQYFLDNFIKKDSHDLFKQALKFYNFAFLENKHIEKSAFFELCKYDYSTFVNYLMKSESIDVNEHKEKTAFYVAVEKENIEIVKLLLMNDKTDLNIPFLYENMQSKEANGHEIEDEESIYHKETKTAFYVAIEKENIDIIKLLLSNDKIDFNIPFQKDSYEARSREDPDFKEDQSESYICKKAALYLAVELQNIEIVKLLLTNDKIDINYINKIDITSVYFKNKFGKYIEDNNEKEIIEQTALNCAIGNCDIEIIKIMLMNEKLDINILNKLTSSKVYNNKAIINEDEEEEDENNSKTNISNEKNSNISRC